MKRILVIDDDTDTLDAVRLLLELNGYEVITSSNGEEATENVVKYSPQIILLDVYLKGSNGVEITNRLRSNTITKHIPIIMISAETNDYLILRKCAADDFIAKPFDEKILLEKIDALLKSPNKTGGEEVMA